MQLITEVTTMLLVITASALSARSAVVARHELAALSVVFFDDVNEAGASYSPATLVQGACNTLPGDWLDRAQSVKISPGYSCFFYDFQGCESCSSPTALSGTVNQIPPALYDNIESFFCSKAA